MIARRPPASPVLRSLAALPGRHLSALCNALLAIAALPLAFGCASPTELVVVVDTDLGVPDEVDQIVISLNVAPGYASQTVAPLVGNGAIHLPLDLALESDRAETIEIQAVAIHNTAGVLATSAVVTFAKGESHEVDLALCRVCQAVQPMCPMGATCINGMCSSPLLSETPLFDETPAHLHCPSP